MDKVFPTMASETELPADDNATVTAADIDPVEASGPKPVKHEKYYFDMVVFQLAVMSEGTCDAHPIVLEGVSKAYFEGSLLVMHPFQRTASTFEEWVGALDLATMWNFGETRQKAIAALSKQILERDAVENVLLAKKYGVRDWLRDSIIRLVEDNGLKLESLRHPVTLDWETISRIFAVQAYVRLLSKKFYALKIHRQVDIMFENEFKAMDRFGEYGRSCGCSICTKNNHRPKNSQLSEDSITTLKRHGAYYFEDITIQANRSTFGKLYGVSGDINAEGDSLTAVERGASDSHKSVVITLSNIGTEQLSGFLNAIYPLFGRGCVSMSFSDWVGALEVATLWTFKEMGTRNAAIAILTPMLLFRTPAEGILLGIKCGVRAWIIEGYTRVIEQPTLTYEELRKPFELEWKDIAKVFYIRSVLQQRRESSSDPFAGANVADRRSDAACLACNTGHSDQCACSVSPRQKDNTPTLDYGSTDAMSLIESEFSDVLPELEACLKA
ncbi:hypothetical protein NLJ89_g11553 [Agrocybe chaxingu]|uniref:BTB domain-containing protein n=1 Tax=Agrocybe chaxingu TaxID=84603 RepID=A0A9W8JNI2_9AGAR|nr:hypothetical protein NLJ89_g11553 [Agrocybe chaxingu]